MIGAEVIERRLRGLDPIGRRADGFHRLAWTAEDEQAGRWFAEQAAELGLRVERDAAGNRWALPDAPPPWWGVGSHLDTVAGGGRYDGALGVACAFEIARASALPVAVLSFADEEGARFNTPTFGSRALVGRLDVGEVLERAGTDGVTLREAMAAAVLDPEGLASAPDALGRLRGFLEIHIDQSRELAAAGAPAGVVSALAGRMRVAVELQGEADHAGTTRRSERRDALAAAARLVVAAEEVAPADPAFVVTPTRILAAPNALTTIAGTVRLWLDARAPRIEAVDAWRHRLEEEAAAIARDRRVEIGLATSSRSPGVAFDAGVQAALGGTDDLPHVVCFAGHDAGVLAERVPAGMVLVRNPTGVSHHPAEHVELEDAAVAADIVTRALEVLAA
jgi:beta-ureidopropionase / N-carbamoyl-L-amino-acid hydrolase